MSCNILEVEEVSHFGLCFPLPFNAQISYNCVVVALNHFHSVQTTIISIVLFSSPSMVVLFLVILPELFPFNSFITISACLFSIPANCLPFGDCLCLYFGINSEPSLLFASRLLNIDFPANPALAIYSSRVWKKGNISSRGYDSCRPYPDTIRISLPIMLSSTTMSLNSSLYSYTKIGLRTL